MSALFQETDVEELINSILWEEKEVTFQVDPAWGEKRTMKVKCYKGLCFHQELSIRFLNGAKVEDPRFNVSHIESGYSVTFQSYQNTFYTWRYAALFLIYIVDLIDWTCSSTRIIEAVKTDEFKKGYAEAYRDAYLEAMHLEEVLEGKDATDPEMMFTRITFSGGGTYQCSFCGSQDNRVGGMKAHIRRVHLEGRKEA